jgi:hypothetical protein
MYNRSKEKEYYQLCLLPPYNQDNNQILARNQEIIRERRIEILKSTVRWVIVGESWCLELIGSAIARENTIESSNLKSQKIIYSAIKGTVANKREEVSNSINLGDFLQWYTLWGYDFFSGTPFGGTISSVVHPLGVRFLQWYTLWGYNIFSADIHD